jgi:hypothetical protein
MAWVAGRNADLGHAAHQNAELVVRMRTQARAAWVEIGVAAINRQAQPADAVEHGAREGSSRRKN